MVLIFRRNHVLRKPRLARAGRLDREKRAVRMYLVETAPSGAAPADAAPVDAASVDAAPVNGVQA